MEDAVFALGAGLKLFAVSAAAVWLGWIALQRAFSQLHLIWAGFCVGMIAIMLIEVLGRETIGAAYPVMAIASCASCSFFWLTSRALFRHDATIGWPEITIVSGIFLPTIFDQFALGLNFGAFMGEAGLAQWMERLDGMQAFFSSAALLLAFGEGLNGWSGISDSEKRIRYIFLSSFGAGVVICVMLFDHGRLTFVSPGLTVLIQGVCAVMIMFSVSLAIIFRQKNPLPTGAARKTPPATDDEIAMARRACTKKTTRSLGPSYRHSDIPISTALSMDTGFATPKVCCRIPGRAPAFWTLRWIADLPLWARSIAPSRPLTVSRRANIAAQRKRPPPGLVTAFPRPKSLPNRLSSEPAPWLFSCRCPWAYST
jgi:hypothetical protein